MAAGARWLGKPAPGLCPSAVAIVDADHGRAQRPQVAAWHERAPPARQPAWCEAAVARLVWGAVPGGIWGLPRMPPTAAHAAEEIAQLSRSLQRHQERLDERCARQGGDPSRRGGIASAHTCSGHGRLQRSGAWWDVTTANPLRALRCATDHGTVDRVVARYRQSIPEDSQHTCPKK